jgi:phosphoglycolate phosphatase
MRDFTIVFDLDGTLVDTAPDLIGATNHALLRLGLAPVAGESLRPWISFGARRMIVEALSLSHVRASEGEIDGLLEDFLAYYETHIARESRPFPGAIAAARTLLGQGAKLAICTNKREHLSRALLSALQLDDLFAALAGRDTFPVYKPHPEHLTGAVRLAGGDINRAIMVGDSEIDVKTARAAGIPIVAVAFGYSGVPIAETQPDRIIDHFDALIPALRELTAQKI